MREGDHAGVLTLSAQLEGAKSQEVRELCALYRGEALLAQSDFKGAEKAYLQAASGSPATRREAMYGAAWALYRSGGKANVLKAAKSFGKIAADGENGRAAEAAFWSARAFEDAEQAAEAAAAYGAFSARKDADATLVAEARYRQALNTARKGDAAGATALYTQVAAAKLDAEVERRRS